MMREINHHREIREIKPDFETRSHDKEEEKGFMKIKPEGSITIEEAKKFWKDFFSTPNEEEV